MILNSLIIDAIKKKSGLCFDKAKDYADSVNHQDEIKRIKECVNSGKIIIYKVKNADTVKA